MWSLLRPRRGREGRMSGLEVSLHVLICGATGEAAASFLVERDQRSLD